MVMVTMIIFNSRRYSLVPRCKEEIDLYTKTGVLERGLGMARISHGVNAKISIHDEMKRCVINRNSSKDALRYIAKGIVVPRV